MRKSTLEQAWWVAFAWTALLLGSGCGMGYGFGVERCFPNPCNALHMSVCTPTADSYTCSCEPGYRQDADGRCVAEACSPSCAMGYHCDGGICVASVCEPSCNVGETCLQQGTPQCVCGSRASCEPGTHCESGACVADVCSPACQPGQSCITTSCVDDRCESCAPGYHCVGTSCVSDPCIPSCGPGEHCEGGSCDDNLCTPGCDGDEVCMDDALDLCMCGSGPACGGSAVCVAGRCVSPCQDGLDNDADGWIDAADPDCLGGLEVGYGTTACNDGQDNDGDSRVDGLDPECTEAVDDSEASAGDLCADGLDNDTDGWIDGADPDCLDGDEVGLGATDCNDGQDNDGDLKVDAADPDCSGAMDNSEGSSTPAARCPPPAGGPPVTTRWVELGVVVDHALYQKFPSLAAAKAAAADIVQRADLMYRAATCGVGQPAFRLKLTQLLVFTDGDPYVVPPNSTGMTSPFELRDTFAQWSRVHFRNNDARHLLTGFDIGSALGVANRAAICSDSAASLSRSRYPTAFPEFISSSAQVLAHEVGHTIGTRHDGREALLCETVGCDQKYRTFAETLSCDDSDFMMAPSGNIWATEFSDCSQYQLYVIAIRGEPSHGGTYGGVPSCVQDAPESCEDDPGAECSLTDPCCNPDCHLIPASQSQVCRRTAHLECDLPETCNGVSGVCPGDLFVDAGDVCTDITGEAGRCYTGQCHSYARSCDARSLGFYTYTPCPDEQVNDPCGDLWCVKPPVGNCGTIRDYQNASRRIQVDDGVPCASGRQCLNGACVSLSN